MNPRRPSPLALAIFDRLVENEALKGDVLEEFGRGRSQAWLWGQLLGSIACEPRLLRVWIATTWPAILIGGALAALVCLELVFVTNAMAQLLFGPDLPDLSGYLYLAHRSDIERTAVPASATGADWLRCGLAVSASLPLGYVIARLHERHYGVSLTGLGLIVMLLASLAMGSPLNIQLATTLLIVAGLFAGGRLAARETVTGSLKA